MALSRTANGALAGMAAAAVWAAQQPLDKRLFRSQYDDVELVGKAVTRGPRWYAAGLALHLQNGAVFGAAYALFRPVIPAPPLALGVAAGLTEHVALWPLGRLVDRYHPARDDLAPLSGNRAAFAQAAWRHILFGALLAELERRLNAGREAEPPAVPVSSNGRGQLEVAVAAA